MPELMDAVAALLREAAAEAVLPVFGRRSAQAQEHAPGEWVTTADRAAEALLAPRLAALVPGSVVVGEEAVAADPSVLDHLVGAADVWLVDPLDGTANFAAGRPPFALMAALLRGGEPVAGWLLDPLSDRLAAAERGGGAWLDDRRVRIDADGRPLSALRGAVLRRFLPATLSAHVRAVEPQFGELTAGSGSAGHDYPAVATGELDFALYWRTLPWDHVPGTLFLREAGGVAARLDASPYTAAEHARPGLLVARSQPAWARVRAALVG